MRKISTARMRVTDVAMVATEAVCDHPGVTANTHFNSRNWASRKLTAVTDRFRCNPDPHGSPNLTLNLTVSFGEGWLAPEDPLPT